MYKKRKYEILLIALLQHLFIGVLLNDLPLYTKVIWPINMLILGIAC
ncbi:MAG: two pore domain potassium channel family protein, partial [Sphingobacteriia bacterium]|nr:two pore domain potassium channel family protein [Sphingobacteriia bacterium]